MADSHSKAFSCAARGGCASGGVTGGVGDLAGVSRRRRGEAGGVLVGGLASRQVVDGYESGVKLFGAVCRVEGDGDRVVARLRAVVRDGDLGVEVAGGRVSGAARDADVRAVLGRCVGVGVAGAVGVRAGSSAGDESGCSNQRQRVASAIEEFMRAGIGHGHFVAALNQASMRLPQEYRCATKAGSITQRATATGQRRDGPQLPER